MITLTNKTVRILTASGLFLILFTVALLADLNVTISPAGDGDAVPATQEVAAAGTPQVVTIARQKLPDGDTEPAKPQGWQELSLERGQTLGKLLNDEWDVAQGDIHTMVEAMKTEFSPRDLKAGQVFRAKFTGDTEGNTIISALQFRPSPETKVVVQRAYDGSYSATKETINLTPQLKTAEATINTSLFAAGEQAGVPSDVMGDLIYIYSWDVDFQRDIQEGDGFEILFEQLYDDEGNFVKNGSVLMANLTSGDSQNPVYRMELDDGTIEYFKPDGMSVKRALLRTPIDGARISSNFGMRRHPILGYNKMHQGTDFAAPTGTPIYAAGDGVVERIGTNGGYGKYVRLRHRNGIKTAYAHLSRYKKGLKRGSRVKQRDVIGYVGSTGRSTGPHLHYEVHVNGKKVNPRGVKLPTGIKLKASELASLKSTIKERDQRYASLHDSGKAQPERAIGPLAAE